MGEQNPDEVIKALKLEQKLLEDRLKDVAMKLRLIIIIIGNTGSYYDV